MQQKKQTLNRINDIIADFTRVHLDALRLKEYIDHLKCEASDAIGEKDRPYDCIEMVIERYKEQELLIETMIGKHAVVISKLLDIVDAYRKKDVVALENAINEAGKISGLII